MLIPPKTKDLGYPEHFFMRKSRIIKPRFAWDWYYKDQYKIKKTKDMLIKAGYKKREIMVFIICNWKISFEECMKKLDLLKVWGLEVSDCYFDNQVFPNVIPIHWSDKQNREFRRKCRKHNHLVYNDFDPEVRR